MDTAKPAASLAATGQPEVAADMRLAAAVLRKDRKATAEFVERYTDPIYTYLCRRLMPRLDLVDDLLQEVFLAAWENLGNFRGGSSLQSWLLGIARHKVEDHYRVRLRAPENLPDEEQGSHHSVAVEPLFDESMDRQRLHLKARRVLESLPENYSAALLWRYWERRSALEMARQTGKTVKAIERLLARAREQFRRRWNDE